MTAAVERSETSNKRLRFIHFTGIKPLHLNLRSKFILSFFILVLIPFAAFGFIIYQTSERIIRENISSLGMKNITNISTSLDRYVEDIQATTNLMFINTDLINYFSSLGDIPVDIHSQDAYTQLAASTPSYRIISNIIGIKSEKLSDIYFLSNNHVYFVHPIYSSYIADNIHNNDSWYIDTLNKKNTVNIFSQNWNLSPSKRIECCLSMTRTLLDPKTNDPIGIFRFDFDTDALQKVITLEYNNNFADSMLFITDCNNNVVFGNHTEINYPVQGILQDINDSNSGTLSRSLDGEKVVVVYYTSPYSSLKTISIIPANKALKDLTSVKNIVVALSLVCLLMILISSSAMSSVLLKPIRVLASAMDEIQKGNLSTRITLKNKDETKYLADSFNEMASNIETLINKVYLAELRQKEAELHSLQSQINPHFLYNTLESIRGAALFHGTTDIAEMAKNLSLFFRYSIHNRKTVGIREEISHLENYILIQNFRHDNKFELQCHIAEELLDYQIPKLILQPLVENSIKHGLETKLGKGCVCINIIENENTVTIDISDNGNGMPAEKLSLLNHSLAEINHSRSFEYNPITSSIGIGIHNVNSRIRLIYGASYGLRYLNVKEGTTVRIKLPRVIESLDYPPVLAGKGAGR